MTRTIETWDQELDWITDEKVDSLSGKELDEFLKRMELERYKLKDLARSRYELDISYRHDLCTLRDLTKGDGGDVCRYYNVDQYEEMDDWLSENGFSKVLDPCDKRHRYYSLTFAVLVRPELKDMNELHFRLRWWDEGEFQSVSVKKSEDDLIS